MKIAVIGHGEAGSFFASAFRDAGLTVAAFDTNPERSDTTTAPNAAKHAALILSTVTASNAGDAARSVGPLNGALYVDLNSIGPATKASVADIVTAQNGRFIEAVAMDTVPQRGLDVPLLLCGADAEDAATILRTAKLNVTTLGPELGMASTTKLTRSILMKGLEALFADAMEAGAQAGVTDAVLASMQETFPGINWRETVGYHLGRMAEHGTRRASEMRECAKMLEGMGRDPAIATTIADRHARIGAMGLDYDGESVEAFTDAVAKNR